MKPWIRYVMFFVMGVLFLHVFIQRTPSQVHVVLRDSVLAKISPWWEEEETLPPIDTPLGPKKYSELEREVFNPLGYTLRKKDVIPALDYITEPNCPEVFAEWLKGSENHNEAGTPPRHIPPELLDKFTLSNHTHLILAYSDERQGTRSATWSRQMIDGLVNQDISKTRAYSGLGKIVYYAMNAYASGITGKSGIVIGSQTPWLESFPLKLNASHVRTIEYMKVTIDHPKLDYRHPVQVAKEAQDHIGAYDWAASYSSIEHAGLGRYGDALDPIGDLKESLKTYCMLKKGGYFFLGFPMGYDTVHWNLHRIYGRIRLALMAAGFDIIDLFYTEGKRPIQVSDYAKTGGDKGEHKQFVIVLQKR